MSTNCTCPHCQRHVSIKCHKGKLFAHLIHYIFSVIFIDQQAHKNKQKKFVLQTLFERFIGKDRTVPSDLYKINITQSKNDTYPPKRFVFDLIEDVPKHVNSTGTNTKHIVNESLKKTSIKCNHVRKARQSNYSGMVLTHINTKGNNKLKHPSCNKNLYNKKPNCTRTENDRRRMDVYYFDHGNAAYYQTTDLPPAIKTEFVAERTESYAKKFWAEFFGTLYIGCAFITTFILQFFRFERILRLSLRKTILLGLLYTVLYNR
ncbi:hypothetical protein RI129_008100 [Pyrocoelia pectoralis]|uniref:Uncharacterized protein n=1 Tax=Pyrocoelia pectoralis TaxID=417401 RepID=A0AAN7ZFH7_9COLE